MKGMIKMSEEKISSDIYCWSLDPEDSWNDDKKISRDAAARIYAFGDVTSTYGQVTSPKKEPALKGGILEDTIVGRYDPQALPFRKE